MSAEINFDGIPGPTHNYAGLARGNLAAQRNALLRPIRAKRRCRAWPRCARSRPRGIPQAVLPPHERPYLPALRALGFDGSDADALARAARDAPALLSACSSAAAMWVANAATVSPSGDTADGLVHFTPANLVANFHRSLEAPTTTRVLRAIFAEPAHFVVHDPLPAAPQFGDEGAANHTRFASAAGGVEFFVFGRTDSAAALRRRDFPRGRRARRRRRSRGVMASCPRASSMRSRIPPPSTPACSTTTSSRSAQAMSCSATSARIVEQPRVLDALARAVGPRSCRSSSRSASSPSRRRRDLPVQQPADRARRRPLPARRAAEASEHAASPCGARPSRRAGLADRRSAHVRPAPEHAQWRRPACLRLRVALTDVERAAIAPMYS
jgi:succinylarginine dihydrolase